MFLGRNYSEFLASNTARKGIEMWGKTQHIDKQQQKNHETGPRASVWGDSRAGSILRALRSLWDASRPLKPLKNPKNVGFRGLGARGEIATHYPLFAFKGSVQYI